MNLATDPPISLFRTFPRFLGKKILTGNFYYPLQANLDLEGEGGAVNFGRKILDKTRLQTEPS
jgi:hypothetical protein